MKIVGDLVIGASGGSIQDNNASPTGTRPLGHNGYFYATRVYNAIYNDYADYQRVDDKVIYGKAYYSTLTGLKICDKKCKFGVIGIASSTYGNAVGQVLKKEGVNEKGEDIWVPSYPQVPISVAGWVLAYVDRMYKTGTPLTNDKYGNLTKMSWWRKILFPERMLGIYIFREEKEIWGGDGKYVDVDGRHWVKVK